MGVKLVNIQIEVVSLPESRFSWIGTLEGGMRPSAPSSGSILSGFQEAQTNAI